MLKRLPSLAELGNVAAFLASDQASAMTATLANITCAHSWTGACGAGLRREVVG